MTNAPSVSLDTKTSDRSQVRAAKFPQIGSSGIAGILCLDLSPTQGICWASCLESKCATSTIGRFPASVAGARRLEACAPKRNRHRTEAGQKKLPWQDGTLSLPRKSRCVIPGYSEMCMSGHHEQCLDTDCRCLHHTKVQEMMRGQAQKATTRVGPSVSTMVCPQCAKVPRVGDTFCRADGARLMPGKQCSCGKAADPDDVFCGGCGQRFGLPAVPVPELSEDEIAALEAKARSRPSDVEVPPVEVR